MKSECTAETGFSLVMSQRIKYQMHLKIFQTSWVIEGSLTETAWEREIGLLEWDSRFGK